MSVMAKSSLIVLFLLCRNGASKSVTEIPSSQQVGHDHIEPTKLQVSDDASKQSWLQKLETLPPDPANQTEPKWSTFVPPIEGVSDELKACMSVPCDEANDTLVRIEMNRVPKTVQAGTLVEVGCTLFGPSELDVMLHWKRPNATPIWTGSLSYEVQTFSEEDSNSSIKLLGGVLNLYNLSESDSGNYSCFATLPKQCCYRQQDVRIVVYKKTGYDADLVIVAAIAFVEIVAILTLKTWQRRSESGEEKKAYPPGNNSDLLYTPLKVLSYKEIERKPEDQSPD